MVNEMVGEDRTKKASEAKRQSDAWLRSGRTKRSLLKATISKQISKNFDKKEEVLKVP
jgi:hypothetical protein